MLFRSRFASLVSAALAFAAVALAVVVLTVPLPDPPALALFGCVVVSLAVSALVGFAGLQAKPAHQVGPGQRSVLTLHRRLGQSRDYAAERRRGLVAA